MSWNALIIKPIVHLWILLVNYFLVNCMNNYNEESDSSKDKIQQETRNKENRNKENKLPVYSEVPVLCYHYIMDRSANSALDYTISTAAFKAQL